MLTAAGHDDPLAGPEISVAVAALRAEASLANKASVDRLDADARGACEWRTHWQPPRNQAPQVQNPRGRAVA